MKMAQTVSMDIGVIFAKNLAIFLNATLVGGSVMVWGAFCSRGTLDLRFTSSKMNSSDYIEVLESSLIPFLRHYRRIKFVFQQDNARIHTSRETLEWFQRKRVTVLDWPARSPDINPMENLWGILVRKVYTNNRQFQSTEDLKRAIHEAWNSISGETLMNLINSMNERLFQLINRSGRVTDY
jgi:transposase